jgi:hypothetical protein
VRRAFGIPDTAGDEDARRALIGCLEVRLHENGWQVATRAIAEPMMDALLVLGANGDLDDYLCSLEMRESTDAFTTRDGAHRLIDRGMMVVDPEHLAFDVRGEYPPEVVAAAQQVLERVAQFVREPPSSS